MRRGMILLGFWMCVCMVFLVNAQEHTSRKLYCTDEDRAIFDRYCTQMEPKKSLPLDELMIHTPFSSGGLLMSPLPWKRSRRAWWPICGNWIVPHSRRPYWLYPAPCGKKILPLRTSVRIYSSSGTETARSMITRIVCII